MNKFATRKTTPPIRPLFSTFVKSEKTAKHKGIPKPNETPKRQEIIKTGNNVKLLTKAGNNETIAPKVIHEQRNFCLLILFDKIEPIMLEIKIDK